MKEILGFLEKQKEYHTPGEIKKGLDILGIKFPKNKVILVTGTNGKGSTCATLQTLLIASGKNVGFFSSPHIIRINERIKYNGADISDKDFCRIFRIIHEKVKHFHFSFFEYLMLISCYYFYFEKHIDFAIFEIGLGGTLDATNAIDHDISVITRIGIDHEDVLGKGLIAIARNKFGIIRKNNVVFHTKFPKEISYVYFKCLLEKNAQFFEAPNLNYFIQKKKYPEYVVEINNRNYKLNLLGERAIENTSLAIEIFKYLVPNYSEYLSAVQDVNWPCRMEKVLYKNRDVFLSGDHNPQGIQSLMKILKHFRFESIHFIVGICFDKDSDQMIEQLKSVRNAHIYLTETPVKTLTLESYSEFVKSNAEFSSKDQIKTLDQAVKNADDNDLILVTGSLYLTSLIKQKL